MPSDCEHTVDTSYWRFVEDWYGNPDIPFGIKDCSYWECTKCGTTQTTTPDGCEPDYEPIDLGCGCDADVDFIYDPFKRDP